jgi:sterol O-acyltransferase
MSSDLSKCLYTPAVDIDYILTFGNSIRPLYVLEKTIATFGTFFLLYQYTEHYIMPHIPQPGQSFIFSFLDLALPFMVCYKRHPLFCYLALTFPV